MYVCLDCIPSIPRILLYTHALTYRYSIFSPLFPTVHIQDTLTATCFRFLDVGIFFFLFLRRRHVLGNIII
jgi:hypothetical protein